jgi:hypothetical protein
MKRLALVVICIIFLGKGFAQQSLLWAKGLNGNSNGIGLACISDASGNVYHTGQFSGIVDFDPGAATFTIQSSGANDIYIAAYDQNGNLLWAKDVGAGGSSLANSIAKDAAGNLYITGTFTGIVDFDPSVSTANLNSGSAATDVFVARYNSSGNYVWAKSIGVAGSYEAANEIKVDAAGNSVTTGNFYGTIDFDPSASVANITASGGSFRDVFIWKLDANGNFVWAKAVGGALDDSGQSVYLDAAGNVFTAGYFSSVTDLNPSATTTTFNSGAGYGTFILKLDAGGNYIFASTFSTSSGNAIPQAIAIDGGGNICTQGYLSGTADFDPGGGVINYSSLAFNDIFVSKLDPSGNYVWTKLLSGSANEVPYGMVLDANNNIFSTGTFQGTVDFDPSGSIYNVTSNGSNDIFISKLDANGVFMCAGNMGGTNMDEGRGICLDPSGNIHNSGYYISTADFDPGAGSSTITTSGSNDAYISKYARLLNGTPMNYTICAGISLTLTGNGANTYSWSPAAGLNTTSGTSVIATPSITTSYTVIGTGNCYNTSTVVTINVKAKPIFVAPTSPQTVVCVPDSILLQSTTSNTNTTLKWRVITSSIYTNQPYYVKTPGNYYAVATDTFVGCSDSALIQIKNGKIPPNAYITSHIYVNALTPVDTVTCYQPTVTLIGASDTSNVIITWKSIGNNSVFANPANITTLNNLKLIVKRNDNQCSDSSVVALINQNNTPPTAIISNTNAQVNCSSYTVNLSASFAPANCTSLWNTPLSSTITNPNIVSVPGKYKLAVTNPDNGCVKLDSVNVLQTNSIVVTTSPDLKACKNSATTLSAQAIGTLAPVNYSWSNGQTTATVSVSSSVTTNYIVTASSGSCIGTSTVKVNVAADIQDSIVAYRSCNDNTTGTILIFAKGGILPYMYSINNGSSFSASNSFTGVPFGAYSLVIKDSLGCTRQTTANVNSGSNLPVPKFLASTKNSLGDSIVLVDISIPKPDSVQWVLPLNVTKVGGNMFNPIIVSSDTGDFVITMKAFYGSCIINSTKLVRFAPYDSLIANYANANGVKTFSLYPNPNTGQFTVYIEFYKKQNASVQVWDVAATKHYQQNYYDVISINLPVDVSYLQNGGYLLRVIAEFDARNKPFIISK